MRRISILAVLAVLVTFLAPGASVANAAGDVSFTADFEPNGTTITAGNFITDQYPFLTFDSNDVIGSGWTFGTTVGKGVLYQTSYENPIVTAGNQHGGSYSGQVACPAEFCGHGTYGLLNYSADSISVYAGNLAGSLPIELDAYDASKNLLGSDAVTPSSAGAQNLLSVTAPSGSSIAYYTIYQVGSGGGISGNNDIYIDDLTVTVPAGAAPAVSVTAPFAGYELGRDGTINIPLTVHRINGASASATVNVSGFTGGVTGSASGPGTGTSSTLTVSASHTASENSPVVLTLSASAAGAQSRPSITVSIQVVNPILAFAAPSVLSPRTCSNKKFTVQAQLAPGEPTGAVGFATSLSPATTGLNATATTPATVSNGLADTNVTLTSTGGGNDTQLYVQATLSNGDSQTAQIPVGRLGPQITSAGPLSGKIAHTPQARGNGSTIEVYAQGVCDTATVQVGNQDASATATVQHLTGNQGAYDYLRLQTPRLATSGPVTITTGSPPATSDASAGVVAVDSYRNTNGWKFRNFDPDLTWDDLVEAYGDQQTYFQFDACAVATLGISHCPADLFPDPTAVAWLAIADASLEAGTCFGMSFASQRILEGDVSLQALDGSATTIFSAPAPNVDPSAQAKHGIQPVLDLVKSVHLMQLSTGFVGKYLGAQLGSTFGLTNSDSIATSIDNIIGAGRYPIIQLFDGTGHILVAYDITQTGPSAYDIYLYDVNDQFSPDEAPVTNSNQLPSGDTHHDRMLGSVLHLAADGSWSLASTVDGNNEPFHGGLANINVFDPNSLPLHPSLGSVSSGANGLTGFLANSGGTLGGAGGNKSSAATVTQVSSGGKTLYATSGGLNTDPSTRLRAAPYAPIVGASRPAKMHLTAVGGKVHDLTVSTTGKSTGPAAMSFIQGGYVGEVDATTSNGAKQQDSFGSDHGTTGYTGTTKQPVDLKVIQTISGAARTIGVHFGSGGTGDHVTLAHDGSVSLSHSGAATSYSLTLSGGGKEALPGTFTSGKLHIGAGKTVTISRIHWTSLGRAKLQLQISGHTVVVHNHSKKLRSPKITRLKVGHTNHHGLAATVTGTLPLVPAGSRASVVWTLRRGHKILRKHIVDLAVKGRHLHLSWHTKAKGKRLRITATVIVFALGAGTESGSVATRSKTIKS